MKKLILFIFFNTLFFACSSIQPTAFKTYVDTTSKPISKQVKQTFIIDDKDVYASNDFNGARLNDFKKLNDSTALALINPENVPINNSAYYAFKIWSKNPKSFYVTFKYPEGHNHRYISKIFQNNHWTTIDSSNVFKIDSITTIKLNLSVEPQIVAAQKLEDYNNVLTWSKRIALNNDNIVKLKYYGTSSLKRKLPVLELNNGTVKDKDVIVLLTRQHPPEVTGYYAFQDFINTLLLNSNLSRQFFEHYQVIAFPILNPDGVELGHWRHNANGVDTNRDWSLYNQKEIKSTVKFINKYIKKNNSRVVLGLDFHSTWYDVFYTNKTRETTTLPHFIEDWFTAIEGNYDNYKVNEVSGNSTKPVSKGWFLKAHNAVGVTFEIGDDTDEESIEQIAKTAAEQMMEVLLALKD